MILTRFLVYNNKITTLPAIFFRFRFSVGGLGFYLRISPFGCLPAPRVIGGL